MKAAFVYGRTFILNKFIVTLDFDLTPMTYNLLFLVSSFKLMFIHSFAVKLVKHQFFYLMRTENSLFYIIFLFVAQNSGAFKIFVIINVMSVLTLTFFISVINFI